MADLRETGFDHIAGDKHAVFYSGERKWINHIWELKEQYPDEVEIRHVNPDGSVLAYLPFSWFRIRPKKKVNMTEEQIAASKARLEQGRLKRLNKNGDGDAQKENGKE